MNNEEIIISGSEDFDRFVKDNNGAVVYFSTPDCNVCRVLKPKVKELLNDEFPEMEFAYADLSQARELGSQNSIFAVPTILIFLEGKEFQRKSRNISIDELRDELTRPYSILLVTEKVKTMHFQCISL